VRWFWKATVTLPGGVSKTVVKRGFLTKRDALADLHEVQSAARKGAYAEPSKRTTGSWLDEWLAGLRLAPSTMASYRKNLRLHVKPYIGDVPLASLTSSRLTALYRQLEAGGRHDGQGGLSARTVRYIHTIISAALKAATETEPPLLVRSPAAKAVPPSARQARPPEMHPWTAEQLGAFLAWSAGGSDLHAAWRVLAYTGMRRGELLALRWRDIDTDAATIAVRRSVGVVRNAGEGAEITEGVTKTGQARVIDLDDATVAVLKSWKRERGELSLPLARPGALVFATEEGGHLHPERFWRTWKSTLRGCLKALGDAAPPEITIHDLRHTHASLLLSAGEPVSVVSERLGHASEVVTLTIYSHVLPGDQRRAATRFADLIGEG
jgi:integrase